MAKAAVIERNHGRSVAAQLDLFDQKFSFAYFNSQIQYFIMDFYGVCNVIQT